MRMTIRTRLTLIFVLLGVLPLLMVAAVVGVQSFTVQSQQALALRDEVAQRVSTTVSAFVRGLEDQLQGVVQVRGLIDLSPEEQRRVLSELLSYQAALEELALVDATGQEQIRLSRLRVVGEADLGDRSGADEFLLPAVSGETYYSLIRFDELIGEPLMTISVPIFDPRSGEVDGVLVADARMKSIWDLIANTRLGEGESVYIVDDLGRVIAHRNPSVVLRGTSFEIPAQEGIHTGLEGETVILAYDPIEFGQQSFYSVAEKTAIDALRLTVSNLAIIAGLVVLALVTAAGLGLVAVRQIVEPIESLALTAESIAAGDLARRVGVQRRDEIGRLAEAFNAMTSELEQTLAGLERRVSERTVALENRSLQFQTSAEVGSAVASIRDLDKLLDQVTALVSSRFGFYHVGIFLLGPKGEYAVLRAANSEGGKRMLARDHRLSVGAMGIVGYVTGSGQPRIALDVGDDAVYFDNPDLPETRSELALPLIAGGQILGALDVQSTEAAAFDEEDIAILRVLADLIAVAIENARLFTETESALESARRAYGELIREDWARLLRGRRGVSYISTPESLFSTRTHWRPEMMEARQRGQVVRADGHTLAVPIQVRQDVIGVIRLRKEQELGGWTADEIRLVETLTNQLGVALEGAQLYQDAQRRAGSEQLVGQVTSRMRETLDVDTVLRTAIREIGDALGIARVEVRLGGEASQPDGNGQE